MPAITLPSFLADRHGFARDHGLVERGPPLDDLAVDRHLLAWPDAQPIANLQRGDLNFFVGAIGPDTVGRFGREIEERLDSARGRLARPELQELAEQDEHRDHGGRLEVDGDGAIMSSEGGGKDARQDGRYDAVDVRDASAHCDQGEHVQIARQDRLPPAHEERPACPKHDRSREDQLNPVGKRLIDPAVAAHEVTAHFEDHDRNAERETHPESAGHVDQLRIRARVGGCELGFERHAADGATAWTGLADLRMHRAGIDRAVRQAFLRRGLVEILPGFGNELGAAPGGAEVIRAPIVLGAVLAGPRVHRHPANGILHLADGIALGVAMLMIGMAAAAARLLRGGLDRSRLLGRAAAA